jgi:hypothetical protein
MKPARRTLTIGLSVVLLELMMAVFLYAAESPTTKGNWDNLRKLAPGDNIRIVLNDMKSYPANFQSVSDEAIVLRLETGEQSFARESVLRVSAKGQSHRGRNALLGLLVGGAAGAIVAVASPELGQGTCSQGSCVDAGTVSALGFVGGGLGAGIGAAIPTGGWHDVYRAR